MRVALAQINSTVGDIRGNSALVRKAAKEAKRAAADLVIFPELCLTGYPPKDLLGVSGFVDANIRALRETASACEDMAMVVGFVDRNPRPEGRGYCNAAAFIYNGSVQEVVHKTLLPTYDVFDEERYFEKSDRIVVIPFRGRKLGISICEDAWNAREFWPKPLYGTDPIRSLVESGADLLINISASPFEMEKPAFRYRMLRAHVQAHRVPLLFANLVGGNDELLFDGNSLVLGASGNVIARAKSFEEDLLISDTESGEDMGYHAAGREELLVKALVMGTRDYARKCGFSSAVLGLSGGIDSAVTACIAAGALGPGNVLGVSLPSAYSSRASHDDACELARNLGIGFLTLPIMSVVETYREVLSGAFVGLPEDETEENLQARTRGNILMALSNKFGHLVLSTGNKSELGVGYCTLYGDMAGGLAVLSDVPKTLVYRLARHINRKGELIPANSISRPPSAELRLDQTDQDTLPDYETLDGILKLAVEEQYSLEEIMAHGYDRAVVADILKMIHKNEYKRRQAAPGLRVTGRAFGSGRRMPIAMKLDF